MAKKSIRQRALSGETVFGAMIFEFVLRAGRIAGAGLDVTEREPIESPLLGLQNTMITPHALCWTDECFHDIAASALQSIVDVPLGRRPTHIVNAAVYG